MAKIKGVTKACRLSSAKSLVEKFFLLRYGWAAETVGGSLVAKIDHADCPALKTHVCGCAPKYADALRAMIKRSQERKAEAEKQFTKKSLEAIAQHNAKFFRDAADAVELIARNKGRPVDKYRDEILNLFLWLESENKRPTKRVVVEWLRSVCPELEGKSDLPRQVDRWCKELGVEPAKGSSARTGKHWRRISGRRLPPGTGERILERLTGLQEHEVESD